MPKESYEMSKAETRMQTAEVNFFRAVGRYTREHHQRNTRVYPKVSGPSR